MKGKDVKIYGDGRQFPVYKYVGAGKGDGHGRIKAKTTSSSIRVQVGEV